MAFALNQAAAAGEHDEPLVAPRRLWTMTEKAKLATMWRDDAPVSAIAADLDRSPDAVTAMRRALKLPERDKIIFRFSTTHHVFYIFAKSPGVRKLLNRIDRLREWVAEGRDDYELARAFHVPIGDVETVVRRLGLVRPWEAEVPAEDHTRIARSCMNCREPFIATRYRFRCDACHGAAGTYDASKHSVGRHL